MTVKSLKWAALGSMRHHSKIWLQIYAETLYEKGIERWCIVMDVTAYDFYFQEHALLHLTTNVNVRTFFSALTVHLSDKSI